MVMSCQLNEFFIALGNTVITVSIGTDGPLQTM